MPKVSVVMSVYNGERFVAKSVESILNQTFRDFEFIIINDASSDNTLDILNSYKKDKRVRIVSNQKNLGIARSLNLGLREAAGEYIAKIDADDFSFLERLERQVEFLDTHPDIGLLGTSSYRIDEDGEILCIIPVIENNSEIQKRLVDVNWFNHSSLMFRKELVERIGGYREEFKYAEDYDLVLRMSESCKVHNLKDILCTYRWHQSSMTYSGYKELLRYSRLASYLAKERRAGRPENLQLNKDRILKQNTASLYRENVIKNFLTKKHNTLLLSGRYYGIGCIHLYQGDFKKARRMFLDSLRYSLFNIKAYICLFLTLLPFSLVKHLRFLFRNTREYYSYLGE